MEKKASVRVKICGLRRPEDVETVNVLCPDYAGFIVEFPRSFRSVSTEALRALTAQLREEIRSVGVFVNAPQELVARLLNDGTISMAQLHGNEDEGYISGLKKCTDRPLIQAFSIKTEEDIRRAQESRADYILLDQGKGGSGKAFDWSLIRSMNRPFFLAGGIGPENVKDAILNIKPFAVDLSSSVETDQKKDPKKMKAIMEIIRNTEPVTNITYK